MSDPDPIYDQFLKDIQDFGYEDPEAMAFSMAKAVRRDCQVVVDVENKSVQISRGEDFFITKPPGKIWATNVDPKRQKEFEE